MSIKLNRKGAGLAGEDRVKENQNLEMIEQEFGRLGVAKEDAAAAKLSALEALAKANAADSLSKNVQTQLSTLVVEGDSSPQALQASVGADGTEYGGSLKARLDAEQNETMAQLADKAQKAEVRLKADNIGLNDADAEMLAAIEGGSGTTFELLSVPRQNSVDPSKATFFKAGGKNLFNRYTVTDGFYVDWVTGNLIASASYIATDYMVGKPTTVYSISPTIRMRSVVFYDINKVFISAVESIPKGGNFTTPAGTAYIRGTLYSAESPLPIFQLEEGLVPTAYEQHYFLDTDILPMKSLDAQKFIEANSVTEMETNFFRVSEKNLLNHLTFTEKTYVSPTTGLSSYSETFLFNATGYLPVVAGDTYVANTKVRSAAYYDETKTFVSGVAGSVSGIAPGTAFVIPAGATFIRINFYMEDDETAMQFEKGATVTDFEPYFVFNGFLPKGSVTAEKLEAGAISGSLSKWSGKKFKSLGDSITWQDGKLYSGTQNTAIGYQTIIKQRHNFAAYDNHGVSGRPMANGTANGDGTNITGKAQTYTNTDLVIIAAGTNDAKLNVPLGTKGVIGDTSFNLTTFYGAYRDLIEFILTQKPTIRIVLFTPLQRDQGGMDVNTVNTAGHKLIDYANAIKELGELYGLPVCDMYRNSGFTKKTLSTFTMDGLHPNDVGYARMGDHAASFLSAI